MHRNRPSVFRHYWIVPRLPPVHNSASTCGQSSTGHSGRVARVRDSHAGDQESGLLLFYVLATSKVISERLRTCDSVHSW